MLRVINIKDSYPNTDYAMYLLDEAIRDAKIEGVQVLIVIHGYGSHGVGGSIKTAARLLLKTYKRQQKIATFVAGEEWGELNSDRVRISKLCPEVILSEDLDRLNAGVTVVLVYE